MILKSQSKSRPQGPLEWIQHLFPWDQDIETDSQDQSSHQTSIPSRGPCALRDSITTSRLSFDGETSLHIQYFMIEYSLMYSPSRFQCKGIALDMKKTWPR